MSLCDEISKFISDNGIAVTKDESGAIPILHCPEDVSVIPVSINSRTLSEAEDSNRALETVLAEMQSKKSIIIPEDLWRRRQSMMECRLLAHLGRFKSVFARNTEVHRITKPTASEFLDRYHLRRRRCTLQIWDIHQKRRTDCSRKLLIGTHLEKRRLSNQIIRMGEICFFAKHKGRRRYG